MLNIASKLDLEEYILVLKKLFSRDKSIVLEGDVNIHYKLISQISKYNLKELPEVANLDLVLMHLKKQGTLKLDEIYQFVKIITYFLYLKEFNFEQKLGEWSERIVIPQELKEFVEIFDDKGNIKQGHDENLDRVNQNMYNIKGQIKQSLYTTINNQTLQLYLVDRQVHLVHGEQTILVRAGFNNHVEGKVIHRSSAGFFYLIPNSILKLKEQESVLLNLQEDILYKLCKEYSNMLNKYFKFIYFINKEFDRFDHYMARIFFSKIDDKNFVLPNPKSKEQKLINFKHPALLNPKAVNIDFGKKVIIITGVNAGGKTMLLKSVLSAVFMSKYLIPYHCDTKQTKIGSFKDIIAILDDPQNVKNDISTFAGRMVEFSKLFNKSNAIIGVDEIELGTDSDEAASLFKVILEKLIFKNVRVIITTHHKRLAALMAQNPNVELIAALYDQTIRKPKYEFIQGTIGQSFAFETASRYGIPLDVINAAKTVYGDDKNRLNELIEKSSTLEQEYQYKIKILDMKIEYHNKLNKSLEDKRDLIDEEVISEKNILYKQYKDATHEARKAIKTQKSQEAHRFLNKAHKKVKEIKTKEHQEIVDLKVGDRVKYKNIKGVITFIKNKKVYMESDDGIKIQVYQAQLKKSIKIPRVKPISIDDVKISIKKPKSGYIKIDLHGQRAQEAMINLDKFISDSLILGFDEVLVYHGIGTGKLSYAVKMFLQQHPRVRSFEDALTQYGGFGAKIVKL
ncbi:Recombination inhibitory protein MutS2 [hydrothermal vent metagenome]|uniref:Recombination inhibitory protein MutS2 n=1 Tax=hydrothermal vent metagenome TaxID=652676 RepID=A0A3B1E4Q6_9ZZZZ